jgi:mannose-6-phosphate isomerase-like protein (cupin superfamily)
MASFAITNLRELDDVARRHGMPEEFSARFAREDLEARTIGLSLQSLTPGARQPFGHAHGETEEVYVILRGSGEVKVGDEIHPVGAWDVVRVAPEVVRSFAAGPDGIEWLAFGTHPAEQDAEQVPGHFT